MSLISLITFFSLGVGGQVQPPPIIPVKAIYLTADTVSGQRGEMLMDEWATRGGTAIVFDIQIGHRLAYDSKIPLSIQLENRGSRIGDLKGLVGRMHAKNLQAIARFVLFKNGYFPAIRPNWALKSKGSNRVFENRDGPVWLDVGNPELIAYYKDVVDELVDAGVDEVQFDYVRFPEGGKGGYIGYSFTGDTTITRDEALTNAVKQLADVLHKRGAKVSIDVFGIVVWEDISWRLIGQNIRELAKYVDAIYPMPYPSHFGPGWGGHTNPADEPYFFVQETTKKFVEQTAGTGVSIRPWLQAFAMRVTNYGPKYVTDQVHALEDMGLHEFAGWNASNNYNVMFGAFPKKP